MVRAYTLVGVRDTNGHLISSAVARAYDATTRTALVLSETQTVVDGTAAFVALADAGPVDINVLWSNNSVWLNDVLAVPPTHTHAYAPTVHTHTYATVAFPYTKVYDDTAAPVVWTDLDLSAVVGVNSAIVLLRISTSHGAPDFEYGFRRNGEASDMSTNTAMKGTEAANVVEGSHIAHAIVTTDTAGVIEWICESNPNTTLYVEAYIK
jgi:hypothetical protein